MVKKIQCYSYWASLWISPKSWFFEKRNSYLKRISISKRMDIKYIFAGVSTFESTEIIWAKAIVTRKSDKIK